MEMMNSTTRFLTGEEFEVITERRGRAWETSVFRSGYSWAGALETLRTACAELALENHMNMVAAYS